MNLKLLLEGVRVSFRSLRAHRLRTLLTMLGVAIGIFAVTLIFTLVDSLSYNIGRNLSALGNRVVYVHHIPWTFESMEDWQKYINRPLVSWADYTWLKKNSTYADAVAFEVRLGTHLVKRRSRAVEGVLVYAVTEDYMAINAWDLAQGRPFTELEVDAGRQVCVIGHAVAEGLFPEGNPLGQEVNVKGKKLKVIGVLAKQGGSMFTSGVDEGLYMPYPIAPRLFNMESRRLNKMLLMRARSEAEVDLLESEIVGLMRSGRGLRPSAENDFAINKPEMLMNMVGTLMGYLQLGGTLISLFALLVGGFGIGNIMYATVKERTFEIGLQKALGATRGFILFQFLTESVLLCLLGGLLGLLLQGVVILLLTWALSSMGLGFDIVFSLTSTLFGLGLSAFIGLASGFFPSWQASRLDPVESMRQ